MRRKFHQIRMRQLSKDRSLDSHTTRSVDTTLLPNRRGCQDIVAGAHFDVDTRFSTGSHSFGHTAAQGIFDGCQTQESQILGNIFVRSFAQVIRLDARRRPNFEIAVTQPKGTKRLRSIIRDRVIQVLPALFIHRCNLDTLRS